jgi:hypothetical protein
MIDDDLKAILEAMRAENAQRFDEMHQENAATRAEVRSETAAIRTEMREENAATRAEVRSEAAAIRTEMREENAAIRTENSAAQTETRRHFGAVAERLEARFEFLAETVQAVNERVDRLDKKVGETAAETGSRTTDFIDAFQLWKLCRAPRSSSGCWYASPSARNSFSASRFAPSTIQSRLCRSDA